jgi:predicted AAA+ superfamily ATPase
MRLIKREILDKVLSWINRPEIIVITGSRQAGKTTLLKMILDELKTPDKVYFDLEDLHFLEICNSGPHDFVNYLKLQGYSTDKRLYVAIDEIQYLNNPSNFLKILHDHYPGLKLIVTGSSTMEIKQKFRDSLTGRKIFFELNTFSFNEFLKLKNERLWKIKQRIGNIENIISNDFDFQIESVTPEFASLVHEYIIFGGYPKPIQESDQKLKTALINEIYSSYVRKDIKDIGQIVDIIGFNNLLKLLAAQIGNMVNYSELSNTLQLNLATIKKYLFLLENTFIISQCNPYFRNKRKEISKMSKVYFQDIGMRNVIMGNLQWTKERVDLGSLLENFIFMELKRKFPLNERLFYWRTLAKAEVDFIIQTESGEIIPVEVKAQPLISPRISRSFRNFIQDYKAKKGIVVNLKYSGIEMVGNCKVFFIPAFVI